MDRPRSRPGRLSECAGAHLEQDTFRDREHGGNLAARYLAEIAPRDGTTIGGLSPTLIFEPLFSANNANVDFLKFAG
jgi:hypothetical protein